MMNSSPDIAEQPARILIVDDDPGNRQVLEAMLSPERFVLLTASSGEEALAIVAEHPPDLILLDVLMPHLDGFATCERLKQSPTASDAESRNTRSAAALNRVMRPAASMVTMASIAETKTPESRSSLSWSFTRSCWMVRWARTRASSSSSWKGLVT